MRLMHVVGARPNFMKAAPVLRALKHHRSVDQTLVHTGQHYDQFMSEVFFQELEMPRPHINLDTGPGTHAEQTAAILTRFEPVVIDQKPDLVLVYGDVNSTIAAALVCAKLLVPVGHVEAGLRAFDRTMPEEINRRLTDHMADWLFTPSMDANENLLQEGIAQDNIYLIGNVMIDTLVRLLPQATRTFTGIPARYVLVTMHRPATVDDEASFRDLMDALLRLSHEVHIVFPIHPRTQQRMSQYGLVPASEKRMTLLGPLSYLDCLSLQRQAAAVITDSGGIQEETTFLKIPCITFRDRTERPITVTVGTNRLVGRDPSRLLRAAQEILDGEPCKGDIPPLWDGRASERIAAILTSRL